MSQKKNRLWASNYAGKNDISRFNPSKLWVEFMKDSVKLGVFGLIVFIFGVVWSNVVAMYVQGVFIMGTGFGVLASTASISRLEKRIPKSATP
jgi:hypothetical protein